MARDSAFLGREDVLEGINEEDFKRREFSRASRPPRVWMRDSARISMEREYAANLYNFAWAQAVQNKPLVNFVPESVNPVENVGSEGEEEKEEGELEEGEFVLASSEDACDSDKVTEEGNLDPPPDLVGKGENSAEIGGEEEIDFDSLVVTTLEELEAINEDFAEKSFEEACHRLNETLDSLHEVFSENRLPLLEALVDQAFVGVQTVFNVFQKRNNQGRETLFRLLAHMKNRVSEIFTPDREKEIDQMMEYVASAKAIKRNDGVIKVGYLPLLDLHSNHDGDSLPSPTREGVLPSPDWRRFSEKPEKKSHEKDGTTFSTYQQKFSHATFLPSDELPSPTPSEEHSGGDGDLLEVSSSSLSQQSGSFISPHLQNLIPKPIEKVTVKSRDPRLKHSLPTVNGTVPFSNPRKHAFVDQPLPDNPIFKRQKPDLPDRIDDQLQKGLTAKEASIISSSSVASLLSLLKNVAGDPSILANLIKEKQKLALQSQPTESLPSTSSPQPALVEAKNKESIEGPGKIRMKSRDPRRILHSNMLQKSEPDPRKSTARNLEGNSQVSLSSPPSTLAPDVSKQVNKGVKSLSDATSASRVVASVVSTDGLNDHQLSDRWGDMDHLLDGYDELQKATIQAERARRIEEQNKMIANRKLCLVLDLDHTLLNSAKFSEVDPIHEEILRRKEEQDREKPQRSLYRFPHMGMWTKLRPGIWSFLERASELFELHLYTMGNKLYATEMAKVLDPSGRLFSGRVISKGDEDDVFDGEERIPKSKDLDGVLGMESAVVIIDDSLKVWPHHKLNLIVVERYTYFPCSRRQFGMPGPSLLEIDHDERLEDGTLASSLAVIERIHRTFFSSKSPGDMDVRNIIALEQRKILSGCRILFSRIFPVGEAKPHLHPLWQIAEQFGATCSKQIDEGVTHVVAYSLGTDKVNWALSTGRFVIHPGWVEASALLYRRANEADFAIKPLLPQPP